MIESNENMKIKFESAIRSVCLALALVNQLLVCFDYSPLPIADEQITTLLSTAITIGVSVWAWWKNNSFTVAAIEGDKVMHEKKRAARLMK